jgi:hypothetical protein
MKVKILKDLSMQELALINKPFDERLTCTPCNDQQNFQRDLD